MYLWKPLGEQAVAVNLDKLPVRIAAGRREHEEMKRADVFTAEVVLQLLPYRLDSLIDSFWARALHSDVFPVPGGPVYGKTKRDKSIIMHSISDTTSINNCYYC